MASAAAIDPPSRFAGSARYNRIRRWIGVADFILNLILMVRWLVTGWTSTLRDVAYKPPSSITVCCVPVRSDADGTGQNPRLASTITVFRLEHRYQLSNLRLRAWIWDETKGFHGRRILAGIVAELLYFIMRQLPSTVADRLGRVLGWSCFWRSGSGGSVFNFLQVRTLGKRGIKDGW